MSKKIDAYERLIGPKKIAQLYGNSNTLKNLKIVHINSTKEGGGVAEILSRMIPLMEDLGLNVQWHVIKGNDPFFQCTKMFHNLLQGEKIESPSHSLLQIYEETNANNASMLHDVLQDADIVFIHDPQPFSLITHFPNRKGKWIWRCHIDLSKPSPQIWDYLKQFGDHYDACIFSMKEFAQTLSSEVYIIPPSIDPFSQKNIDLSTEEIKEIYTHLQLNPNRPTLLQVSRFDRFKDPIGVIEAYRMVKDKYPDLQLILAGGSASDDPEGEEVLKNVKIEAQEDPDIHILVLPSDAHRIINGLQRGATIVLQKSIKEGFGLTVAEALWKAKPVIGGDTGGIRLQLIDGQTGFLVTTPQQAADRIQDFLKNPQLGFDCGKKGKELVTEKFLITRQMGDYLQVMVDLTKPKNC